MGDEAKKQLQNKKNIRLAVILALIALVIGAVVIYKGAEVLSRNV